MNWAQIGKTAVRAATTLSVGQVIRNAIDATTPETVNRIGRASLAFGGLVISSMIGDMAADYVVEEIDKLITKPEDPKEAVVDG